MKRGTFFAFASPSIAVMIALMALPLAIAIFLGMNFMTFTNITEPQFIGLRNFQEILTDDRFWQSFSFTALYMFSVVPAVLLIGFVMALVLDQVSTLTRGFYLSIFLLPFIIVPIVGTLMFKQLFESSGPITWFYREVLETRFRFNEQSVKALIIIYGIWYVTPFALVVYFAGLQTLPREQMEAASIDGANWWQKILFIIIPHVRSLTLFLLLFTLMDTYRVFDSVFVLTELNPTYRANTLMTYTFQTAVSVQRLGKANAMAIITVLGILVVLVPNLYYTYKEQIRGR